MPYAPQISIDKAFKNENPYQYVYNVVRLLYLFVYFILGVQKTYNVFKLKKNDINYENSGTLDKMRFQKRRRACVWVCVGKPPCHLNGFRRLRSCENKTTADVDYC